MRLVFVSLILFLLVPCTQAQNADDSVSVDNPGLRQELLDMVATDQSARRVLTEKGVEHIDSLDVAQIQKVDAGNRLRLTEMIAQHGWPTAELVGQDGMEAAFLLVQHADPDPAFQKEMLPWAEQSYRDGVLSGQDVALLTDRVLTNQGKPQRYGTQVEIAGGEVQVLPIEDREHVDERRSEMGMPPLQEYIRELKRVYGLDK